MVQESTRKAFSCLRVCFLGGHGVSGLGFRVWGVSGLSGVAGGRNAVRLDAVMIRSLGFRVVPFCTALLYCYLFLFFFEGGGRPILTTQIVGTRVPLLLRGYWRT